MTVTEALAASPTGVAVRKHNREFMMAVFKGQRAVLYGKEGGFMQSPIPQHLEDWHVLKPGPTFERLKAVL